MKTTRSTVALCLFAAFYLLGVGFNFSQTFTPEHKCEYVGESATGRDSFCIDPQVNCQIFGTECDVEGNIYTALSRKNFVQFGYEHCSYDPSDECEVLTSRTDCMAWSSYSDLGCNDFLCIGRHKKYDCD